MVAVTRAKLAATKQMDVISLGGNVIPTHVGLPKLLPLYPSTYAETERKAVHGDLSASAMDYARRKENPTRSPIQKQKPSSRPRVLPPRNLLLSAKKIQPQPLLLHCYSETSRSE